MFCEKTDLKEQAKLQEQITAAFEQGRKQGIAEVEERIDYEGLMSHDDWCQAQYEDYAADALKEEYQESLWE